MLLCNLQAEVEAAKVALEQAEMSAVVAATECLNMQKVHTYSSTAVLTGQGKHACALTAAHNCYCHGTVTESV